MTYDVVAVLRAAPEKAAMLAALGTAAAGRPLGVWVEADGRLLELCDEADRPLLSVAEPLAVHVPGEVERLLGMDPAGPAPVWWVEIRAQERDDADAIALAFARALVRRVGGTVWSAGATLSARSEQPSR